MFSLIPCRRTYSEHFVSTMRWNSSARLFRFRGQSIEISIYISIVVRRGWQCTHSWSANKIKLLNIIRQNNRQIAKTSLCMDCHLCVLFFFVCMRDSMSKLLSLVVLLLMLLLLPLLLLPFFFLYFFFASEDE